MAVAVFQCKKCDQQYSKWYKTIKSIPETRMCPACTGMSRFVRTKTAKEIVKEIKEGLL